MLLEIKSFFLFFLPFKVQAVDSGTPVKQTATATVSIFIDDVNNKPPQFTQDSYVQYIPESRFFIAYVPLYN